MSDLHPEQQRALDYLARKGTAAPVETLRSQMRAAFESIEKMFDDVPIDRRDRAPEEGKWSPRQILDHLVLSHAPAIAQLESLLRGAAPAGVAIPARLHSAPNDLAPWNDLRDRLAETHRGILRLIDDASDEISLQSKATIEMVVKIDSKPVHWHTRVDWKAFAQAIRVHTLEHRDQLQRTMNA